LFHFPSVLCLASLGVLFAAQPATAGPHKLRVEDPALAQSLLDQGARLVGDYGSFKLIETPDTPPLKAADTRAQPEDRFNLIELNAHSINTRSPQVQSLRQASPSFAGKRLHLVHFTGPIKPEWRQALEQTGARIISYLPNNAYLVYGDATRLQRLQRWAGSDTSVQWDGPYLDDYKIHPHARSVDDKGSPRSIGTDTFTIQLVADGEANASTLATIDQYKLRPVRRESRVLQYLNIVVALPADRLNEIAAQPDVISIQPCFEPRKQDERQDRILAGALSGTAPSGPGYLDWLATKGFAQAQFTASGFVVDVSDSGIDNGTTQPGHFGLYALGNPSQSSRVAYNRFEGTPNPNSTLQGCDGHGTLNGHVIAGYDSQSLFPHTDSGGFSYGLGVCPFVRVGSSVVFDPDSFTDPNYTTLQTQAYNSGARISSNSWGSDNGGAYDSDAQSYDALVRDVGASSGGRQMVIVFSSGNSGPAAGTVGSPGVAKNVITVGAAENVRSLSTANGGDTIAGDSGCGADPDTAANNANDIADFSSRGPCSDGRAKPDLVAPGTHVTGGVAQAGTATTNGVGSAIPCFSGNGVCGLQSGIFFPLGQEFYTVSTGTSHSAPAVAGACALLRQFFINGGLTPPSPAMTKAFLMNSARYLTGAYANDTLWSQSQGMGEVNLGAAFDATPRILRDQVAADTFTASGQTRKFIGYVVDPSQPFLATVAWTDAPGSTTGSRALVNDLDLTVTIGGKTYKGNVFSGRYSTAGGTADSLNNVESVFLPAGASNTFTATITAANISADALSIGGSVPRQDFALVICNGSTNPAPVIAVKSLQLAGESFSPTNGAVDPGETVTVEVEVQNIGSIDATNLVLALLETNGILSPGAEQDYGAAVAQGAPVTRSFTFTAGGSCGDSITPTFRVHDGSTDLGLIASPIRLGAMAPVFEQNFDNTAPSALPAGWSTSATGSQKRWTLSKSASDTPPRSAFSPAPGAVGVNALVSPPLQLPAGESQLVFRGKYDLEAGGGGVADDGGVLEIRIGGSDFVDILDSGGSFVSGGYNSTISDSYGNPLGGRKAWSGDSGGFVTTVVELPEAAAGQVVQFRWRCGTDRSTSSQGWFIDSISLNARWCAPGAPPPPPFIPRAASYTGLFFVSNGIQMGSSGTFTATTTPMGAYSGTLQMGAARRSFSGQFDPFGVISNQVTLDAGNTLTLSLQVDTADYSRLSGSVRGGAWLAGAKAVRAAYNARTNPAPYANRQTLIVPGTADPTDSLHPQGDGYAAASVDLAGAIKLAGALADGTKLASTAKASQDGEWPLYVSLYGGQGQILGWLNLSTDAASGSTGWVSWIKPPSTSSKFYPAGFSWIVANVHGSPYSPQTAPITGFNSGLVTLTGGNLSINITGNLTVSLKNVAAAPTHKVSLVLVPSQGLFSGTAVDPVTLKKISFNGALVQGQNAGSGFFLGASQSGRVTLSPSP